MIKKISGKREEAFPDEQLNERISQIKDITLNYESLINNNLANSLRLNYFMKLAFHNTISKVGNISNYFYIISTDDNHKYFLDLDLGEMAKILM